MSFGDFLVLAAVGLALVLVLRRIWKHRGKCGCGGCSSCPHSGICQRKKQ